MAGIDFVGTGVATLLQPATASKKSTETPKSHFLKLNILLLLIFSESKLYLDYFYLLQEYNKFWQDILDICIIFDLYYLCRGFQPD
ncbi:hypothetical protein SDC9_85641 [bioreactor metagenome]|uniref:Uncharacterized protein n=1 Tax=bioreactor metagenome TaxID=1076179 RepID=A0A644ZDR6_9ZZZZ